MGDLIADPTPQTPSLELDQLNDLLRCIVSEAPVGT